MQIHALFAQFQLLQWAERLVLMIHHWGVLMQRGLGAVRCRRLEASDPLCWRSQWLALGLLPRRSEQAFPEDTGKRETGGHNAGLTKRRDSRFTRRRAGEQTIATKGRKQRVRGMHYGCWLLDWRISNQDVYMKAYRGLFDADSGYSGRRGSLQKVMAQN